jgi:hypothetical protein
LFRRKNETAPSLQLNNLIKICCVKLLTILIWVWISNGYMATFGAKEKILWGDFD